MNRSLILSRVRIEIRRKESGFQTERTMIRNIQSFMDEMSLTHASQIREWHKDLYLSRLKSKEGISGEEFLQTKSSLLFLFDRILKPSKAYADAQENDDLQPGVLRITG